nr:hypothetical protein [uncultured Devosia sp.]
MDDLLTTLPPRFRAVRYDGAKIPDGSHDLSDGANCQRYAYAALAHFGIALAVERALD